MSVKKIVSSEPLWTVRRVKPGNRSGRRKDSSNVYVSVVIRGENPVTKEKKYGVCFNFGGKFDMLFGEKRLMFSPLTDDKRIYFKFDDSGFKCSLGKSSCKCQFSVDNTTAVKVKELWCGQYQVKEERNYYYIEREDPLEALFKDNGEDDMREYAKEIIAMAEKKNEEDDSKAEKENEADYPRKPSTLPPTNAVWMTPMPESGINDKKALAILARMKEKGFVSMADLRLMNMTDRDYYKTVNDLVLVYGYSIVDIPCVNDTGKRFFVKALYNGTGAWE